MNKKKLSFIWSSTKVSEKDIHLILHSKWIRHHRLSDIIDRVVFQRAKFYGGGLVIGYDKRGRADEIPAQLQDGEFVFTAKAVKEIGVDKLYKMLNEAESKGTT